MPAKGQCTVCAHPQRADIDTALLAPGAKLRTIGTAFGIDHTILHRHRRNHLDKIVAKVHKQQDLVTHRSVAQSLADRLQPFQDRLQQIAQQCATVEHGATLSSLTREARANIEMLLKLAEAPGYKQAQATQSAQSIHIERALILPGQTPMLTGETHDSQEDSREHD